MHEIEGQRADRRRFHAGPAPATAQHGAPPPTDGTLSLRLLAAHENDQDAMVLRVQGDVDLGTAPVLREALLPLLEHYTGPVVVDLSEVAFMDSSGVHVLVQTRKRLDPHNRRLAIVCLEGGQVHRLLGLVGLLDALTVYRSRESAVIGGDDLLRSEPGGNSSPSKARAATQSPPSTSPQTTRPRRLS